MTPLEIIQSLGRKDGQSDRAARAFLQRFGGPLMKRFVYRSTSAFVQQEDAEDLLMVIISKVIQYASKFVGTSDGEAVNWINVISKNALNEFLHEETNRRALFREGLPQGTEDAEPNDPYTSFADVEWEKKFEIDILLWQILRWMSRHHADRVPSLLCYLSGMEMREIAAATGKRSTSMRNYLYETRVLIADHFSEHAADVLLKSTERRLHGKE